MSINELVVYDAEEACPYLDGVAARMPLRRPLELLAPADFDDRLAAGDRRMGSFLYNTACHGCAACEPIRLPIAEFKPSRTQRRVWKKGQQQLSIAQGPPLVDEQRLTLFNKHRRIRGLAHERADIDIFSYEQFLVDSCCDTRELRYYDKADQLVMLAVCDVGETAMSAVYTFFDPDYRATSLGVYSVLAQVELCRQEELEHLYLGYFIEQSRHMNYKSSYMPHERRIGGEWRRFARDEDHQQTS